MNSQEESEKIKSLAKDIGLLKSFQKVELEQLEYFVKARYSLLKDIMSSGHKATEIIVKAEWEGLKSLPISEFPKLGANVVPFTVKRAENQVWIPPVDQFVDVAGVAVLLTLAYYAKIEVKESDRLTTNLNELRSEEKFFYSFLNEILSDRKIAYPTGNLPTDPTEKGVGCARYEIFLARAKRKKNIECLKSSPYAGDSLKKVHKYLTARLRAYIIPKTDNEGFVTCFEYVLAKYLDKEKSRMNARCEKWNEMYRSFSELFSQLSEKRTVQTRQGKRTVETVRSFTYQNPSSLSTITKNESKFIALSYGKPWEKRQQLEESYNHDPLSFKSDDLFERIRKIHAEQRDAFNDVKSASNGRFVLLLTKEEQNKSLEERINIMRRRVQELETELNLFTIIGRRTPLRFKHEEEEAFMNPSDFFIEKPEVLIEKWPILKELPTFNNGAMSSEKGLIKPLAQQIISHK